MMKSLLAATAVAAMLSAPMTPAMAFSGAIDTKLPGTAGVALEQVQFQSFGNHGRARFYPQHQGFRGGRYGYNRGGYGNRRGGFGVGAGLAGLAAGAVIGGAIASQAAPAYGYDYQDAYAPAPEQVGDSGSYCAQRYKSYDPGSGTYLGYDGMRHPCP